MKVNKNNHTYLSNNVIRIVIKIEIDLLWGKNQPKERKKKNSIDLLWGKNQPKERKKKNSIEKKKIR